MPIIRDHIDKALSLNPDQPEALVFSVLTHFFVDRAYQAAINEMTDLMHMYPNNTSVLLSQVWLYLAIGRFDLAFRACDRLIELDPLRPDSHIGRGDAYRLSGRLEDARKAYERAELLGSSIQHKMAGLAFAAGDAGWLQRLLNRSQSNWQLTKKHLYPLFEAKLAYLQGNHVGLKKKLFLLKEMPKENLGTPKYLSLHSSIAAIEGDIDHSLYYYAESLTPGSLVFIQAPPPYPRLYPQYRSHPKYQKMLRDVGLDAESIAKLKIPPLPF